MCIRNIIQKRRLKTQTLFPLTVNNYWYSGDFYEYQSELHKQGLPHRAKDITLPCEKFLICQYRDYHGPGSYPKEVGQIIACQKLEDKTAYYEVIRTRGGSYWEDCLGWDDNTHVDLKLVAIRKE